MARIPLSVLTTIDPVLRDTAIFGLVVDAPRTVVLRHDVLAADGALRRVVVDSTGVVEDVRVELEHACLSCAVREDALPVLHALARDGRWDDLVLALPVGAESLPAAHALAAVTAQSEVLRLAAVATIVDLDSVEADLLGIDSLAERDLALTEDDERSVAEALAAQLVHADLVVTCCGGSGRTAHDGPRERAAELVDHLRAPDSVTVDGVHALTHARLAAVHHDPCVGEHRCAPSHVHVAPSSRHVWTIELTSRRPFHPERLLARIEELGTGPVRSRGVFWLPNRPDSVCEWDGAGGQLYLRDGGTWEDDEARTRLVFTGVDPRERERIRGVFADVLAREDEIADGGLAWLGSEDVLAPWLG